MKEKNRCPEPVPQDWIRTGARLIDPRKLLAVEVKIKMHPARPFVMPMGIELRLTYNGVKRGPTSFGIIYCH